MASLFILVAIFLSCLNADIKISDLFFTAADLILSLVLKRFLRSSVIQGVYLSETRRSTRGAYFCITPDIDEVIVLTIVLMSAEDLR